MISSLTSPSPAQGRSLGPEHELSQQQQPQQQQPQNVVPNTQIDDFTRIIIQLAAIVLAEILRGLKVSFGVWLATSLASYLLPTITPGTVSAYAHVAIFLQNGALHAAIGSGRKAIARDGADDDNYVNLVLHVTQIFLYLATVLVLRYRVFLWRLLWSWLPSLGAMVTVVSLWFAYVDDPVNNLVSEGGKLMSLLFSGAARLARIIARGLGWCFELVTNLYRFYCRQKIKIFKPKLPPHYGQPYQYESLGADEIRLLQISRMSPFGEYTCRVVHVAFASPPAYEAISYTWGGLPLDHDLLCEDGYMLKVSERVVEIVQARASVMDSKFLWIDAVCINQGDLDEKASQIKLMAEIYQNASRTIIWLGLSPEASACISFINRHMVTFAMNRPDTNWKALFRIGSREPGWQEFLNFLHHPYWSRMWILQEIVLSNKPIVAYGGEYFTFEYLQTFFREMHGKNVGTLFVMTETDVEPRGPLAPSGSVQISLIIVIKSMVQDQEASATFISDVMQLTRRYKAYDPRDMVYGVLGLLRMKGDQTIVPDYTKTPTEVCVEVGRRCFFSQPQHTLARAGIGFDLATSSLPSWCPDYCGPWPLIPLHHEDRSTTNLAYNASAGAVWNVKLDQHSPTITTQAVNFDTIAQIGPKCLEASKVIDMDISTAARVLAEHLIALFTFAEAALATGPHHSSQNAEPSEITWRTLIGDRASARGGMAANRPADEIYSEHFRSALRLAKAMVCGPNIPDAPKLSDSFVKSGVGPFLADEVGNALFFAAHSDVGTGRRIAVTRNGNLSLVPENSRVGDAVSVLAGMQACAVLREERMPPVSPNGNGGNIIDASWRFVGEAYVHGYMDGEALQGDPEWEEIHIW
jgi:hypothetical protein